MTSSHPIDVEKLLADQLATASPDLLRGLLSTFIQALMSAEADSACGADYGQRMAGRTNRRDIGTAISIPVRSRSCGHS
jgi:putative transposase